MQKPAPFLTVILLLYLLLGALYAANTPAWQAPDEPAHYNYVRQLAAGALPVMEAGDYDQAYLTEVVFEAGFAPHYDLTPIEYEDWQPPLYYLLQTAVFHLADGSLLAMRLFSLLLGAGVVALAYATMLRLAPTRPWLALTTAVFVAFLPQHLAILASVNNDALAELLIAAVLFNLIELNQTPPAPARPRRLALIGALLGLGLLTKGTVYPLTAVVGLALLLRFRGDWRALLPAGLRVFTPAALLGSLWWGRNLVVYGGLDLLGKAAHDAVVVGQPRTAEWVALYGLGGALQRFVQTTFNSFWGQFGWMTLPMTHPAWLYPLLWLFSAIVVAGLLLRPLRRGGEPGPAPRQTLILLALFLLTLGVHAGYNLTFVQHQGRYLFPALIPIGVGVALGLETWVRPLFDRSPKTAYLLPVSLATALIALNLFAIFRVIVPALT